ncbi:Os12g0167800 [Oryza sativa Japonica Group]|uniref:Os12g0167800 protein n=1 Tax=Oryza sativa subsp. japonica TaxID=39947 RepID=A0A0P0Y7D1_ORYSJ|nr:Os12g0167800 [Oryza sativa Japonica Group]
MPTTPSHQNPTAYHLLALNSGGNQITRSATTAMLRELQALCRVHGLPTGGSSADLADRLAALVILPGRGDAAAAAEMTAARWGGKGCLKRPGGGGGSGPTKKVKFILEEEEAAAVAAAAADAGMEQLK